MKHGWGRNADRPRHESARLAKWLRQVEQINRPKNGAWDERQKQWIRPVGTVKQGRRPMFIPFNEESRQ